MRAKPLAGPPRRWPALAVWALAAALMRALDGALDLANLALLLVLASALASLWLSVAESLAAVLVAVLAFNWQFVPPRGALAVDLRQHALLLLAMLVVSWVVALMMGRQRALALRAHRQATQAERLRALGEVLRESDDPVARAAELQDALAAVTEAAAPAAGADAAAAGPAPPVSLLLLTAPLSADAAAADPATTRAIGPADADEAMGLWLCLRQSQAFGPGTGRHEELPGWYLPMRGRGGAFGAALLRGPLPEREPQAARDDAQSICDLMGLALQRTLALGAAQQARDAAQAQAVSNAFLAAISHDYRTPLAIIMGAASSLQEQDERLSSVQRRRLAATIVDETAQLGRMTDNTLQLARLDSPGGALQLDWESAEEIIGAVLRRARQADPQRRLRARIEPGLPLIRCDALLLAQMLDNLVDNALKYGDPAHPVELVARRQGAWLGLAVRDRGAGIAPEWRGRVFEVFQRGTARRAADGTPRRGAGVGLAVCRAIARAHGGELTLRPRGQGGSSFECRLPLTEPPPAETPAAEVSPCP